MNQLLTDRLPLAVLLAVALLVVTPVQASAADGEAPDPMATEFTPDEFLAIFDDAVLDGLAPIEGSPPAILGDADLDARIRAIGVERGYRRRASPDRDLVAVDGVRLQPEAAEAWEAMQAAARDAGHSLTVTSGYRSVATQISIFKRRLTGYTDAAFDRRLHTVAVPGYSKHHTGYAIDIRSSTGSGFAFRNTAAFAWLADDNFANAKRFGWIPSYPEGTGPAGPVPEPWELVWVGTTNIVCADFTSTVDHPLCDTHGSTFASDILWLLDGGITTGCRSDRYCTTAQITRAEVATMLWRYAGSQATTSTNPFDDVEPDRYYSPAVRWLADSGHTTGTTPTTFDPERDVTRAEFVTLLWRIAGRPTPTHVAEFDDVDLSSFAVEAIAWAKEAGVTTGTSADTFHPHRAATRGEAAAFIRRFAELPTT